MRKFLRFFLVSSIAIATFAVPIQANAAAGTVGTGICASSVSETANVSNISTSSTCMFKFTTSTTTLTFPTGVTSINFLVVGGGGQGGGGRGGGGGGGSFIEGVIDSPASSYSITVGTGGSGAGSTGAGANGGSSSIGVVVVANGGGGGGTITSGGAYSYQNGSNGGSGGGAGMNYQTSYWSGGTASTGTVPTLSTGYSTSGAASVSASATDTYRATGGGGGAGSAGTAGACVGLATSTCTNAGAGGTAPNGGSGRASSITGSSVFYAAGGGGAVAIAASEYGGGYKSPAPGIGGSSIGGNGTGFASASTYTTPTVGTANTGSGGGGAGYTQTGAAGGSGIVIISFTLPPTYSSISKSSGSTLGGTSTVITGTNLTGTTSVTVDGASATLETITSTTLAIKTPSGTAGVKDIVITNASGLVTATSVYTYFVPPVLTGTTQSLLATSGKVAYDTVTATSSNTPISFTLTGNGPAAITIDTRTASMAVLTVGISTTSGVYTETITATDASSISSTFVITVTVAQAISLTPFSASVTKTYGTVATDTITATLGTGTKTLTLTNLTGETNISIDTSTANTAILRVGAAATTGTYAVTINAVDSVSATASLSITISVSTASAITITAATPSAFTYSPSGISLTNSYSSAGLVASDSVQSITYSYSQFSSCATGGSCQIGDEGPGGGRVFYDAGSTQSWGRYLELSPQGWNGTANDPTAPWCTGVGGNTLVGTQAGIGKGKLNTDLMIAACNTGDAANLANSYRGGGKTDWYLANFQEMEQLVINASRVGYSYTMHTLWVSWEWTANGAQDDVASAFSYKFATIGVRPIRAFDITSNVDTSTTNTLPTNAGTYYIIPSAVTLASSHQSNYAGIDYVNGILTINRAEDTGFLSYATAEAVVGVSYSLYVNGGSGTGAVTYLLTGGTASGCSISASVLTTTSEGTCIVQFTRAQSTNYNTKNSSVIITFRTYAVLTTGSVPSDGSSHGIVISGGGTPWSKNATASPTITSFTPSSGPVGTTITITGTGLNGVTVVRLNFEDMTSVTGVSPTSVTAVVQSGATSGPIYIENSYGADFNFDGFTVTP